LLLQIPRAEGDKQPSRPICAANGWPRCRWPTTAIARKLGPYRPAHQARSLKSSTVAPETRRHILDW